jgi:hypothetical protein
MKKLSLSIGILFLAVFWGFSLGNSPLFAAEKMEAGAPMKQEGTMTKESGMMKQEDVMKKNTGMMKEQETMKKDAGMTKDQDTMKNKPGMTKEKM